MTAYKLLNDCTLYHSDTGQPLPASFRGRCLVNLEGSRWVWFVTGLDHNGERSWDVERR